MSQMDDTNPIPLGPSTPGRRLAAAREARGLSVPEVAMRLKFSTRQIEALEADDYDALPGLAIVRGMVRNYAKMLGLDAAPLIAQLEPRIVAEPFTGAPSDMHVPFYDGTKKSSRIYLWLSLLVIVAVAGVATEWALRTHNVKEEASVPAKSAPDESAPVSAEEEQSDTPDVPQSPATEPTVQQPGVPSRSLKRIELQFGKQAWVEITDGEGRVLMSQLNPPRTRSVLQGKPPFTLVIGNAANVKLNYDGSVVDLKQYAHLDVARLTLE